MAETPDFDHIHDEYRPKVLRYLARLVGDADAEDLTQEVFVRVHGSLSGFRGDSSLSTWIYRIATNAALDRLKSPTFKKEASSVAAVAEEGTEAVESSEPVDKRLIREQMGECIRGVVDRLPPDYKTVIVLSELGELTNREVAEVLGVSLEAAKIRLHRARARLKSELQEACSFGRDERNEFICEPKVTPIEFRKK